MRLGICTSPENAAIVKECGYDFFEHQVQLLHDASEEEFKQEANLCEKLGIYSEAMNCMLHSRYHVTGSTVEMEPIRQYLEKSTARAEALGCKTIVFGSAWSRNMPDGFSDKKKAFEQLKEYLEIASDICGRHNITIAIEPLHGTNIITYLSEGHYLLQLVNRENVRLLVDIYALRLNLESYEDIVTYGSFMEHMHFCSLDRRFPSLDDTYDYTPFFDAIKRSGFDNRISIEGNAGDDFRKDCEEAMKVFKHFSVTK